MDSPDLDSPPTSAQLHGPPQVLEDVHVLRIGIAASTPHAVFSVPIKATIGT